MRTLGAVLTTLFWFITVNYVLKFVKFETLSFSEYKLLFTRENALSWVVGLIYFIVIYYVSDFIISTTVTYNSKRKAN